MNLRSYFLSVILSLTAIKSLAQKLPVSVDLQYGNAALELQKDYLMEGDTVRFEKVRFYLSGLRLLYKGKVVAADATEVHLLDAAQPQSLHWQLLIDTSNVYDEVQLTLGTDSFSNVSGAQSGDLDPVHGMYWSWQSGYINVKIEGYAGRCPGRKHKFQYHLGGYQGSTASQQHWSAAIQAGARLHFMLRLDQWFARIPINKVFEVMSPSETAVSLTAQFAQSLYLQP